MKTISRKEFQDAYISPTSEQTSRLQAKLDSLKENPEEKQAERRAKPRLAFVLAAVLLLIGVFTAVAASLKQYTVSWDGKVNDYEPPEEELIRFYEYPEEVGLALGRAFDEGYFTKVVFDGSEIEFAPEATFESEQEVLALLDAEGYPHPTPLFPDGYQFVRCFIHYGSFESIRHLEDAVYSGKYSVYLYSVPPEDLSVFGYDVVFEDPAHPDKLCSIYYDLSNSGLDNHTFIFETDDRYDIEKLTIPGMEKAIALRTPEEDRLHMIRSLPPESGIKAISGKYASRLDWHLDIYSTGAIDDVISLYTNQPENK